MSRGGTRVYFGRLPRDVRERDLEKFVRGYGRVREISVKLGYGFVEFEDTRDADDCVYDLNGKDLLGERVVVEHARNPVRSVDYGYRSYSSSARTARRGRTPPTRTEHRLAVENLSSRCNWQDLKEYMGKVGEVTFADAHKRRQGEGVVEFSSKDDMKGALKKLDETELFGRKIRLKVEKVKSRYSRSHSRSRSTSKPRRRRSRSHSHSQSRSRSPKRRRHSSSSKSPHKSRPHRSTSRSRSASKEKQQEKSKSKSPDGHKSRSASPEKENDVEEEKRDGDDDVDVEEEAAVEEQEEVKQNGEEDNGEEDNQDEEEGAQDAVDAEGDGEEVADED